MSVFFGFFRFFVCNYVYFILFEIRLSFVVMFYRVSYVVRSRIRLEVVGVRLVGGYVLICCLWRC